MLQVAHEQAGRGRVEVQSRVHAPKQHMTPPTPSITRFINAHLQCSFTPNRRLTVEQLQAHPHGGRLWVYNIMDTELAKELREATNQLLDLGPLQPSSAFPCSPHLQRPHHAARTKSLAISPPKVATFSSSSRIEVLHSPTDVRPWHWPVPSSASKDTAGQDGPSATPSRGEDRTTEIQLGASIADDVDDLLPSRGLNSRIGSIKSATGETSHVSDQTSIGLTGEANQEMRAASPNKLRAHTPIGDIYINQYGERVVDGKVVGRILGGRPRPPSQNREASYPSSSNSPPHRRSGWLHAPYPTTAQEAPGEASASTTTSPPAFFIESFPNAFTPPLPPLQGPTPTAPPFGKTKERRPSRDAPPSILKAPRAVAGALTLAHSDNIYDPTLLKDTSFHTASDFGSPSSSSSKHFSPKSVQGRSSLSSSPTKDTDVELGSALQALELQEDDAAGLGLLSPRQGASVTGSGKSKIDLPLLRRPTPTIEVSQAKAEPVVLHGNRRQARASGAIEPSGEADSHGGTRHVSPTVSPPSNISASAFHQDSSLTRQRNAGVKPNRIHTSESRNDGAFAANFAESHARLASASEPSSPLMSPARGDTEHYQGAHGQENGHDDDDRASLESAPSSLISLPVSTITTSSRSLSHTSLERRRSNSSTFSHHRRRSSSHHASSSDVFAREVRIRGWSEVGSQSARGWVVFELRILTKQGTPITAHKRFSSFVKLRQSLLRECKEHAKWLPPLPTRSAGLLSKYDARWLEKRRRALQRWLELVMLDRIWGGSEALREWVLASD